ncbi:MAG: hypothetical protein KAX05_12840 [Bacteroidales bacterium]|nr:hypothetical protein [Bacteroidales bacterium]
MPKSPFKFLDSYTKDDRDIFFGRDREIEEMYQKVFESKILLVYGISGTGKTSLINCGLANKFEDSDWLPVNVRRGRNVVKSLVQELGKVVLSDFKSAVHPPSLSTSFRTSEGQSSPQSAVKDLTPGQIVKTLKSIYLDHFKPIYLIFDQLEELFIFGDREEREQFIQIVKAVVDSDVQCRFIFSIREEYLAGVTEFEAVIPDFLTNRMRIEKMTSQNAIQVIEGPCKVQNIEVEEGFPEALLNKLNPESNEVELTYLQVFLDKIYRLSTMNYSAEGTNYSTAGANDVPQSGTNDSAKGTNAHSPLIRGAKGGVFTKPLLEKAGDVTDLLGSFLEEQICALEDPDTGLTILKSFVSIKGTKRQITEEEIFDFSRTLGKPIDKDSLTGLIQKFINLRILRDKDESGRYELRHDSLADKIYEKITLVEKEILEVRQFVENAYNTYQSRKTLLSDEDLKYIAPYEDRLFLGKPLQEFVNASKADLFAKKRALRRVTLISAISIIVVVMALGIYYLRKIQGKKVSDLVMIAMLQKETSPVISLETAFMAYDRDTTSTIARKAILDAFYRLIEKSTTSDSVSGKINDPYRRRFDFQPCESDIISAKFSTSGRYIYGWLEDNSVKIWNSKGKELINLPMESIAVLEIEFSNDDKHFAVITGEGNALVYSINGVCEFTVPVTINKINNQHLFIFMDREDYFAVSVNNDKLILYDYNGTCIQTLEGHNRRVNGLDVSKDQRFIASASCDHRVMIWNFNKYTSDYGIYDSITGHRDTVWSCQFNNSCKYILTASSDTTVQLWDLMGNNLYLDFVVKQNLYYDYWEYYYFMFSYYKVVMTMSCNAVFTLDEKSILVTHYVYENKDSVVNDHSIQPIQYIYVIIHDRSSAFNLKRLNEQLIKYSYIYEEAPPIRYDFLTISPDDKYIATVVHGKTFTNLIEPGTLQLKMFNGTKPMFSFDGKYLLCIDKNMLKKYLVDIEEIRRLVYDIKIFGELEKDFKEWVTY